MKKLLLLFAFVFAASAIQAQNEEMYSLMHHGMTGCYFSIMEIMQQRDGDFVMGNYLIEDTGDYIDNPLGNMFYKISPTTHTITDSLFVADSTLGLFLLARDPRGEGNIWAILEYDEVCDSTFMRICHFPDNGLQPNPEEDIVVPLCEGYAYGGSDSQVDCRGDLIITYAKGHGTSFDTYDIYMARFDPDGTLKHQCMVFENFMQSISPMQQFKDSPLQYYQWSEAGEPPIRNLAVYVMDSLFHVNTVVLNTILSEEELLPGVIYARGYLFVNSDTQVIPIGGDDILVAAQYQYDTTWQPFTGEYGVAVAKYDIRTMQQKGYIVFNDYLGYYNRANCIGLKMMTDGTVYFLFKEHPYPDESVVIVKMDTDFNVEWKRFCKTEDITMRSPVWCPLIILNENEQGEEQGLVWAGTGRKAGNDQDGIVCFFLNHDGTVGTNEIGIEVRPYAFYPNPVKEQLRMDFSPDVQPALVELYDLQGCLVRTQSKTFESLDMSQLPAGTYTMRVILEDGKVYSDKVVKE